MILKADATKLPLEDRSVDLVIGSPPYCAARDYGINAARAAIPWAEWMHHVTVECLRACRGPVLWVCAGTGGASYEPGPELLVARAYSAGINVCRPNIWTANKPPSGTKWFSNEWEYVLAFGEPRHFDMSPIATELKYSSGGAFRQRGKDGTRKAGSSYPQHKTRRTAVNVFRVPVGGGLMGHELACENEAPYPIGVPERFILTLTKPGDTVLDPFAGSFTTCDAAQRHGRKWIGADIRESQCEIGRKRMGVI